MSGLNAPDPANQNAPNRNPRDTLVARALLNWSRVPLSRANRTLVIVGVLTMVWLTVFAWDMPDRPTFLRNVAMMFMVVHTGWHFFVLHGLKRLEARGIAGASQALGTYKASRRISHLDVAAAWLAFALLVRFFELMSSAGLPALP